MKPTFRRARRLPALSLALAAALLAACSPPGDAQPTPAPPAAGYPGPGTPFPTAPPAAYPLGAEGGAPTAGVSGPVEALVAQAVNDLAQRAGIDPASVQVLEASPQSWPDASLGCPIEGQLYAQVIVEGYRIVLEAGGQRYAYHTDRERATYCEQDQA